jgi:hypothetical protein
METIKPIFLASPHMSDEGYEFEYVKEAFAMNWIAPLGPNVTAFEKEFASVIGAFDAAALVSGTAAIHLAIKLVGVGEGNRPNEPNARDSRYDVVLCSSLTFAASVNPIVYQHATPVLIDSEWSIWNLDLKALKITLEKYKSRVKAVIIVHPYGLSADIDQILAICYENNVLVIEDVAESLGTKYDAFCYRAEGETKRRWHDVPRRLYAGTAADIGCFSFNGLSKSHMVCGFRVGWMIFSGNKELGRDYIEGVNMLFNMRLCSNFPRQSIIQTALGGYQSGYQSVNEYTVPSGRIYEQRGSLYANSLTVFPESLLRNPKRLFISFRKMMWSDWTSWMMTSLHLIFSVRREFWSFPVMASIGVNLITSASFICLVFLC